MSRALATRSRSTLVRSRLRTQRVLQRSASILGVAGLGLALALGWPGSAGADPKPWPSAVEPDGGADAAGEDAVRARAVASPNLRVGVVYDYGWVDSTQTVFLGPSSVQTLELDAEDGHAVAGKLVGTVPLISIVGLRATVRGGFRDARRSLDALEPGSSRIDGYGGLAELFVRDPGYGSFAVGGGFDRLDGESGRSAQQVTASADARIFFPDMGSGPVDWFARFEFRHREVSDTGQIFDVDADVYDVAGGARWYLSPDVALVVTGAWQRTEEEFFAEDDATGGLAFHWRLPLPIRPASIELFAGGNAGVSEYKEPPFRGDHRFVYGARAGLTLRLFSGATLVESIRRYD